MKRSKLLSGVVILLIAGYATYQTNASNKKQLSPLLINNIEALAQEESGEKIYRYVTWQNDECWIYVGGAYAKGKKVSCHSGSDHPRCVDCQL